MDLRFGTPLVGTKTCNAPSAIANDLGVPGAKLVVPGNPGASILALRMHEVGPNRMPPLGRALEDPAVAGVVDAWIAGLGGCP
jgi:hypothetical protein